MLRILQRLLSSVSTASRPGQVSLATGGRPGRVERDSVPLEALTDLVTWHDEVGDVVKASRTASALVGVDARQLEGGGLLERVHISDRPIFLKALSDAANGQTPVCVEFRLRVAGDGEQTPRSAGGNAAGEVIWVDMRAQRLAGRGPVVVIAFTRDTTEGKRRAAELERAKLEAERANELKGRFLATVSHELRTPLNAIIGFSELLSADHPFILTEERRKEYGTIIRNSGHHLLEIVNTLLDLSKIESGNFAFTPEPFGFAELAASSCDLMQIRAEKGGLHIERRFGDISREIAADRRACRQIIINLLSNALKFTPPGGTVTVGLAETDAALVLSIADTGTGIGEDDLPRLGDPFFQAGRLHERHHEGTGLGLSVVRGLVGLHDGDMVIESGAGAGTTVTVSLPFERARAAQARPVRVRTRARPPLRPTQRMTA